jgi:hypothetical protein
MASQPEKIPLRWKSPSCNAECVQRGPDVRATAETPPLRAESFPKSIERRRAFGACNSVANAARNECQGAPFGLALSGPACDFTGFAGGGQGTSAVAACGRDFRGRKQFRFL